MKDHWVTNNALHMCYCGKDLEEFTHLSHFEAEHHYKNIQCSCGRKNTVKVDFHGSGHDGWKARKRSIADGNFFEDLIEKEHRKIEK
jgi:hypothetical protein